ncbi:LacI family DNA-binding transcriptional regulator [Kribbella solani]|uniref:LacI family DNA-binding transcriptional regulator n=1 Tax=Kribbella solani TaxID=236067 RepID=UPI0029A3DC4B|nr:LacI family DNA-binding transcriptional regulator [Kribbella solani]MDX2974167.1 LacI family DNA-binding transcriptional regulator [Kribbella solani]MDX3000095.1 LacI family DNA-binding transcriptional regulator [Kribbella solani]
MSVAVTIRDVARLAGVSPSTVSRAISLPEMVNATTRTRVAAAVEQLGYEPNRAARGLITGRTGTIGLVVPDLANPFFASLTKAIQARARRHDVAVFVADTDEDPGAEAGLVRALSKQVDGIVLCSPRASDDDLAAFAADTTVVLVNRAAAGIPGVTYDNEDGMRQAVAHLVALGHRRIAWVGGPASSWSTQHRGLGLRNATEELHAVLVPVGNFAPTYEGGMAAADQVIATGATAVVAYNDLVAIGLLARLHSRGISVPGELSVVGVDDIAMSGMAHPALTTIRLPKQEAGWIAVELLLALLDNPDSQQGASGTRSELHGELIVRASTGPVPVPDRQP